MNEQLFSFYSKCTTGYIIFYVYIVALIKKIICMKSKTFFKSVIYFSFATLMVGCNKKESIVDSNRSDFSKHENSLEVYEFEFSEKELTAIYNNKLEGDLSKVAPIKPKKKWKFSFTFGGFDFCDGGAYCGLCTGLCISRGAENPNGDLTNDEIEDGFGFAEIAFNNDNGNNPQTLFFYPERSMDNGDGYVRIESDFNLGKEFANETGKDVTIKAGQYKIIYTSNFSNGVGVFLLK